MCLNLGLRRLAATTIQGVLIQKGSTTLTYPTQTFEKQYWDIRKIDFNCSKSQKCWIIVPHPNLPLTPF